MGFLNTIFGGAGDQVKQANQAFGQASDAQGTYGGRASTINSTLEPFLQRELEHPQGFGQQGITDMTSAALGGAGGATSALTGAAENHAAVTNNPSGYATALGDVARSGAKAAAGASEGIAAKNEQLKQTQQQSAASGLAGLYGEDTGAQMKALGIEPQDVNAGTQAQEHNWFNNFLKMAGTAGQVMTGAGAMGAHF